MEQGFSLDANLNVNLGVNPQMLQSITVLQYNALDLEQAITAALETNPLLEEVEPDLPTEPVDDVPSDDAEDRSIDTDNMDDFYGETVAEDWHTPTVSAAPLSGELLNDMVDSHDTCIADILRNALGLWEPDNYILDIMTSGRIGSERILELAHHIIDSLDDYGMLTYDPAFPRPANPDPDKESIELYIEGLPESSMTIPARAALHVIRQVGPSGIASRTFRECMVAKAYDAGLPETTVRMLDMHFDLLDRLQYGKIASAMGISVQQVRDAVTELRSVSRYPYVPPPSSGESIVPEIRFVTNGKGMKAVAIRSPKSLRLNDEYASMASDRGLSASDRKYIREKLTRAQLFINAIGDRYTTMEKVCNAMIRRQADFLLRNGQLHPMTQADIAADTGLSVSTVSRATSGKYADTVYGTIELGSLFNGATRHGDSTVSTSTVIDRIKAMIDAEDPANPLSDQAITNALVNDGYKVSRRAVAKYREETLRIPSTRLRKKSA